MTTPNKGICYLIGAGPGDLGLMTLRGRQCVERADVLVYDYLCNPQMLGWARPEAERIYVGKKAGDHTLTQDEINALIVERTGAGQVVARLKGGDPLIFGRGGEEAQELRAAGVAFELVPGISSSIAGPAYAGIPVTHRSCNSQLTIFTGHEDPTKGETSIDYAQIARTPGDEGHAHGRLAPPLDHRAAHRARPCPRRARRPRALGHNGPAGVARGHGGNARGGRREGLVQGARRLCHRARGSSSATISTGSNNARYSARRSS